MAVSRWPKGFVSFRKQADAAKARGEKHFIPDRPCKDGHLSRYSHSADCVECVKTFYLKNPRPVMDKEQRRLKHNQYAKDYRKKHPEKTSLYVRRWQDSHPVEMKIIRKRHDEKKHRQSIMVEL